MLRTTRSDGPPTSFNSVEQANVVAGPASSVYGPTQNTGGYVDLITKRPFFDAFHSETDFTYGSYDEKIWTEDFGGPIIKNELAYRVSYQGDYSGSYYNNQKTNSNDVYVALDWTPNSDFKVQFNSEFYDGRFNENTGIDRPTQGLISGHQYSVGGTTPFGGTVAGGTGVAGPASPGNPGTFGGLIFSPGTERISDQATEVSPFDSDFSKDLNAELVETYNANENLTLINRTYYEYYELRNTELAQLFVNSLSSNIVQNRTEVHLNFDTPIGTDENPKSTTDAKDQTDSKQMKSDGIAEPFLDPKSEIITGVAFKYVNYIGYQDFENEENNATDLTTGIFPEINNSTIAAAAGTVFPIPGTNLFGTPGNIQPNTENEKAYEASAFFQHQITFTPQWILLYSGRMDALYDDLSDSLGNFIGDTNHLTTSQVLGTGDVSIDYKPTSWVTFYGTFDFNESTAGNEGGGFDTFSNGAQSVDYHDKNYLYEGGVKLDLLDHTLFTAVDGFYQNHNATDTLGVTEQFRTVGAEIATSYQPDKHFYLTLNESYINTTVVDPGPEFTQNVYDAFSTNSFGVSGTGVGSPNFIPYPPGHYREAGLPQMIFSGLASYKLDCGLGVSANYVITDPIPTSEAGNVWIPWQYEIDASLFYEHKNFMARVSFLNITDQHNWSTGGTLADTGNDTITMHEPFNWQVTLGYKF